MSSSQRISVLAIAFGIAAGCHFDVLGVAVGTDDGGVPADLSSMDLASPDLADLCAAGDGTTACSADTMQLLVCMGGVPVAQACDDGCSTTPTPHCRRLDPSGAGTPEDYEQPGLLDITISGTATFDTDTGEIDAPPVTRQPGTGLDGGIFFHTPMQSDGSTVGLFAVKSFTLAPNARINARGSRPLVIVASGDITIDGTIDVRGECTAGKAVAGGGLGGAPQAGAGNPGGGMGGGGGGAVPASGGGGGGGGGFGDIGGTGAGSNSTPSSGGAGGAAFGDLTVDSPILSGGGGGGAASSVDGGPGGSGGGAVQLACNGQIQLGGASVIQASGCHGSANTSTNGAGGGGGAGGAILLEGRFVNMTSGATLAANGGGGGGGGQGDGKNGADGSPDANVASGGMAGTKGTAGGNGGHAGALQGQFAQLPSGSVLYGGGGGGGVGRIALKSKGGMIGTAGVVISPGIGQFSSGRPSPSTVGSAHFQ